MTEPTTPAYPDAPPLGPPAGAAKKITVPWKVIGGTLAVASLVTTAVFTGLLWAATPDTPQEYEENSRMVTCASTHLGEDYAVEDAASDDYHCWTDYGMTKKAWLRQYGPDEDSDDDASLGEDDGTDGSNTTYDECMDDPDTTLEQCEALL